MGAWILANEWANARNALFDLGNYADGVVPCLALALSAFAGTTLMQRSSTALRASREPELDAD